MKHDCDIVRDLMPMCIDGTASEKAKDMVEEHVAECPPCDKIYAEMKGEARIELPVQSSAPEFVTTVKKMKSRRKRRTWLTLLLGIAIAAVVAWAGFYGYYWYYVEPVSMDDVQLSLVVSNDGIGLVHAANAPVSAYMDVLFTEMDYPDSARGKYEGHVSLTATRYEARTAADDVYFVIGNMQEDALVVNNDRGQEVPVYRLLLNKTGGSGQVFYLAGEDTPETMSLRGMNLKSAGKLFGQPSYVQQVVGFITPMPQSTLQPYATLQPSSTPTVMPRQEMETWSPVQNTPTPTPRFTGTPG